MAGDVGELCKLAQQCLGAGIARRSPSIPRRFPLSATKGCGGSGRPRFPVTNQRRNLRLDPAHLLLGPSGRLKQRGAADKAWTVDTREPAQGLADLIHSDAVFEKISLQTRRKNTVGTFNVTFDPDSRSFALVKLLTTGCRFQ